METLVTILIVLLIIIFLRPILEILFTSLAICSMPFLYLLGLVLNRFKPKTKKIKKESDNVVDKTLTDSQMKNYIIAINKFQNENRR